MADNCLEHLDNQNSPEFVPQRWSKVYRDWLVKLKDWCISRQLWWGHQIPAWYAVSETGGEITDNTPFFVAKSEEEARAQAIEQLGNDVKLVRDPDVLDTWFSVWIMAVFYPRLAGKYCRFRDLLSNGYPRDWLRYYLLLGSENDDDGGIFYRQNAI